MTTPPTTTLSLSALFGRALQRASHAADLSTIDETTQQDIRGALDDLKQIASNINAIGLFSPNETVEDISTRDLVYLFVPFINAQLQGRVTTSDHNERIGRLKETQSLLQSYISNLTQYEIVPEAEKQLLEKPTSAVRDPAKRRELKIQQYKKEKDLRAEIETLRKRQSQAFTVIRNDFDLVASLLPASNALEEEEDNIEDPLRVATLVLLRLLFVQAHAQLESMQQELDLLLSMPNRPPSPPPSDARETARKADDDMWRLDQPILTGGLDGRGPLLDSSGKPLRPFTILPAGERTDRARLQSQVFRPDHRLPTMSIDEYLEIERERGNIITGGGPQSEEQLTSSEQLALDAEMDGTAFAEVRDEEKRIKDEEWARFTEANPRGAGNTMNRG